MKSVVVLSNISNIEARTNEIKAKLVGIGNLICLNLLLDLIPRRIGMRILVDVLGTIMIQRPIKLIFVLLRN